MPNAVFAYAVMYKKKFACCIFSPYIFVLSIAGLLASSAQTNLVSVCMLLPVLVLLAGTHFNGGQDKNHVLHLNN
jgi:hypothetical protein